MESELSMNALFCFVVPPSRSDNRRSISAGQSWGKGGRFRRHVPTDTHRQPMQERCGGMGVKIINC